MTATHVRVFNSNEFDIEDRYDGVLYRFPSGDKEGRLVPMLAASLFFGFRITDDDRGVTIDYGLAEDGTVAPDAKYLQRRWGWNNVERKKDEDMPQAMERTTREANARCAKLRLEPVTMGLREVPGAASEELPPPREPEEAPKREKLKAG
jgi:hypothetical protein